jgi:hypothetical protein
MLTFNSMSALVIRDSAEQRRHVMGTKMYKARISSASFAIAQQEGAIFATSIP